jgi:cytoskeletal protein CcmA (bactofilin family)
MNIFICFFFGLIFIFVPFIPAVREALRSTDSQALKITNHILRDPRSSPDLLYWHFAHLIHAESIEALEIAGRVTEASLINNSIFAVPGGLLTPLNKTIARVLSSASIELEPKTAYFSKIISLRSLKTGTKNAINEIHAKENLLIASGTKVIWWASGRDITLENDLDLPGKIQGSASIKILGKAQFLHLEAPVITTTAPPEINPFAFSVQPEDAPARHLFKEHCEIRAGEVVSGDLIVKGNLVLEDGAEVNGSIKCHGNLVLRSGARVRGNLVARGTIDCEGKNWIGGSILGQKSVSLGPDTYVGSENQRITISANTLKISGRFRAHGTIKAWARASVG